MPQINPSIPVAGQPNSTEEPKIVSALSALVGAVNTVDAAQIVDGTVTSTEITDGTIQAADLQSALADVLGATVGATSRRGRNAPATTEITITSASYVTHANDATITVTQPTNGVTLVIAVVDGHGSNYVDSAGPTGLSEAWVAVRVDGATDIFLGGIAYITYSNLAVIKPQDRPGTHTYRLAYLASHPGTSSGGQAFFATRSLFVVTLGA